MACELLDEASVSPWILLSAGVTYEEFAMQVKITCQLVLQASWVATPSGGGARHAHSQDAGATGVADGL